MDGRQGRGRLLRRSAREARRAARALGDAAQRLAERLAYRPREVVVVTLLSAGLFGGLAIEQWRARHPVTADRLEAEPPRPTSPAPIQSVPRLRARSLTTRCEEPGATGSRLAGVGGRAVKPRLDLNRATPSELAQVAGISWRLAARIVAAREAFEGREYPRAWRSGTGRPSAESSPAAATRDAETPEAPDGEPR